MRDGFFLQIQGIFNYKSILKLVLVVSLVSLGIIQLPGQAAAHEGREVAEGKYYLRIGFLKEPAYQGLENGLELLVCKGNRCQSKGDGTYTNGLEGLFDTLKAEVIFGSQRMELKLASVPRNPGRYDGFFVPTRAGDYTFHIFGTIESVLVDERFTSGPDTFDSILALTLAQFPDRPGFSATIPATVSTPLPTTSSATVTASPSSVATSGGNSAQASASQTEKELQAELQKLRTQLAQQEQLTQQLKTSADTNSIVAIVGLVAGLVGLLLAGFLWFTKIGFKSGGKPQEGG